MQEESFENLKAFRGGVSPTFKNRQKHLISTWACSHGRCFQSLDSTAANVVASD